MIEFDVLIVVLFMYLKMVCPHKQTSDSPKHKVVKN